jgi:hypothetical protein
VVPRLEEDDALVFHAVDKPVFLVRRRDQVLAPARLSGSGLPIP